MFGFSRCLAVWFCVLRLNFLRMPWWVENEGAVVEDLHETEHEREVSQEASARALMFQMGLPSSMMGFCTHDAALGAAYRRV